MKSILTIIFQLILFTSLISVKAQSLINKDNDLNQINHVQLAPKKSIEYIVKTDSCLLFVSDFLTTITLPLGKTFEWTIPAGTKFPIPAGKYFLENNSSSTFTFQLISIEKCPQPSKGEK